MSCNKTGTALMEIVYFSRNVTFKWGKLSHGDNTYWQREIFGGIFGFLLVFYVIHKEVKDEPMRNNQSCSKLFSR